MIKNDKKVAFRKHLERLTLSDVRDWSGGGLQLVATGSQGFRSEPRKRLVVLCPLSPSRLDDRSRKPFACPPSSEPAVRRPVICPATTRVHVSRPQSPSCIPRSHLPPAQVVPGQRPAQAMSLGLQCQCPAPESCESPFFNNLWCPVTVFPSGVTSGDVLEPGVNWPHMPAPP